MIYVFWWLMNKLLKIFSLFIWFCLCLFVWTFVQANDYEYKSLDITANVRIDGSIDVKETFTTNFFERKHWIIRSIPLNYSVWDKHFHIDVSNVSVNWSKFTTSKDNENIEIKIWDANKTVIWEQIYPIFYSVYWLIRNFSWMWYHELYWNLVWYDVDTNIDSVKAELYLPKSYTGFTSDDFLITTDWIAQTVKDFWWSVNWNRWDKITIVYDKKIVAWEWITLAIKFPNDYFEFDHDRQAGLIWSINKFGSVTKGTKDLFFVLWFLAFLFWLLYVSQNFLNRKIKPTKMWNDFKSKYPVIVQYGPPKWMNSAEAGLLFNCRADPIDMTSLFYQRAINKFISISCEKVSPDSNELKSVTFQKIKDIPESYPYYERELFNGIFKWDKKSRCIDKNTDLCRILLIEWLEDFWLHKHWLYKSSKLSFWKVLLTILLIILLVFWFYYFKWLGILFLVFFVPLFFGLIFKYDDKIRLTEEWKNLAAHIIGYAKFIKECDEKMLKSFLKQDPLYIDKTLPYAVAFGLETEFLDKVTPLMKDLEKKWLNCVYDPQFPVLDMISFLKKQILLNKDIHESFLRAWIHSLKWYHNKSEWKTYYKLDSSYSKLWWFKLWSIFSWWGKYFKKWWWGGWWGSRSW